MDTKSRKFHKLAKIIIALCVMVPALVLVSLYPVMEKSMLDQKEYYEKLQAQEQENAGKKVLIDNVVNYAMEASYCLYAQMMQEVSKGEMDMEVFNSFGWDDDFRSVQSNTTYVATYTPKENAEPVIRRNADDIGDVIARIELEYDSYGNLTKASLDGDAALHIHNDNLYGLALLSMDQFKENADYYSREYDIEIDKEAYVPKNFKMTVGINEYSAFVGSYQDMYGHTYYSFSAEDIYMSTGAYFVVAAAAVFVVTAAMLLPFVRKLETGKEKIFSISFEIMLVIAAGTIGLIIGMSYLMANTTMWEVDNLLKRVDLVLLGQALNSGTVYQILRGLHFVGWSAIFFLVYIVAANIRQFLCRPKYYITHQTCIVRFFRWLKEKGKTIFKYLMTIDLNNKSDKNILIIAGINFVIISLFCCLWLGGIAAALIYSIVLFVVLRKQYAKIQKQYQSILNATQQMADGNLKIVWDHDLGMFTSIGESLEKVQQGFESAVVEEAKSQNMKTELITNVSHDLKTPLTAIITYVDLLKKENISEEEKKKYINTLEQKSQRLKVLIEDLFEVSKANSGNVKMNYMDVDVVSLLKQVRSEMDEQISSSNLQFRWNLPNEKLVLSLDGQRTYRIFENLLNNILKYAMPQSRVYIDVKELEDRVEMVFRNVSAMELDFDVERLSERFVRGDASRNSEGSGLGLAIAKSFTELQKGTFKIEVDGDLFKVYISFMKENVL